MIVQIAPALRDAAGRILYPRGRRLLAGIALMYATGLLVSV